MNIKDIHKYEQAMEEIKRNFCPILFSFFRGCTDSGFNDEQALHLTNTYMIGILNKPPAIFPDRNDNEG